MPDQRSPSPAAQPPVALTPGVRAEAFNQLYDKTLKKTMTTISYDKFAECFPSIDTKAPKNLAHYHKATIEQMDARMRVSWLWKKNMDSIDASRPSSRIFVATETWCTI